MPLDQLLTFLMARGKISESPTGELRPIMENVCEDGR
jgi:hypothetical protein